MNRIELLSEPRNYAVVKMHDRAFPGVVVQADTLQQIVLTIYRAHEYVTDEEIKYDLLGLADQLDDAIKNLREICDNGGINSGLDI